MGKKYRLTEEAIMFDNKTLYRIEALKDFGNVKKGDKGGFVESEHNLSQSGDCWIYDNAKAFGNARIFECGELHENAIMRDNSGLFDNAIVYGDSTLSGNAKVRNNSRVSGWSEITGWAEILGDAEVANNKDYIVFKNFWSSGRFFTWTRSNDMYKVGCFYGTGEELIKKAYKDSEVSGKNYEAIVKYVNEVVKPQFEQKEKEQ